MRYALTFLAAASLAAFAPPATAQRAMRGVGARVAARRSVTRADSVAAVTDGTSQPNAEQRARIPLWAPLASLAVPGAGQALLGQPRAVAYAAADVYALIQAAEFNREYRRRKNEYITLARDVARMQFGGSQVAPWRFYEVMTEPERGGLESGRYNVTPGGTLTPETDTSTFNGKKWQEVLDLYFKYKPIPPASDPAYQAALAEYSNRAAHDEFRWSWRGQLGQWDVFRTAVTRTNQASRLQNRALFFVGANHLLSAIDALATVRLREAAEAGEQRIEVTIPWAPLGRPRAPRR